MGRLVEITSEVSEPILIPSTYTEAFKRITAQIKRKESMEEPKTETNLDDAITFKLNKEPGEPIIKISYEGKFFVRGKEVTEDKELYNAFVAFFQETGHYR